MSDIETATPLEAQTEAPVEASLAERYADMPDEVDFPPDGIEGSEPEAQADDAPRGKLSQEEIDALVESGDVDGALEAMGFDPKSVEKNQFIALRKKEKALKQKYAAQKEEAVRLRGEAEAELTKAQAQVASQADTLAKIKEANELYKGGDYHGFIKALTGEDFEDFVQKASMYAADPTASKLSRLERERAEEKRQAQEAQKQEQDRKAAQAKADAQATWKAEMIEAIRSSKDESIRFIADEPQLAAAVFNLQERVFNESNGRVLTHEHAAKQILEDIRAVARRAKLVGDRQQTTIQSGRNVAPPVTREETPEERYRRYAQM